MNSGATSAVTGRVDRFLAWFSHHRQVALETVTSLLTHWSTSLMTWLVIGIALALPLFLYLLLSNLGSVSGGIDASPRISVYLQESISQDDAQTLAKSLGDDVRVASVEYISPQTALVEFQERSGFGDVLNSLERNPLPGLIEVIPDKLVPAELKLMAGQLESIEGVDLVVLDLDWIERLFALLEFGERLVAALATVLAMGVLLVIGNTIRLAIDNRKAEIEIVKLVGGTNGFVRRPFLYLGFWYGTGGGIIAWILIQSSLSFLSGPVERLAQSYRDDFSLIGLGLGESGLLILGGASLGVLGAILAVSKHLHTIEPGGPE